MAFGAQVHFLMENNENGLRPQEDVMAEFTRLRAGASAAFDETERLIKKTEQKRKSRRAAGKSRIAHALGSGARTTPRRAALSNPPHRHFQFHLLNFPFLHERVWGRMAFQMNRPGAHGRGQNSHLAFGG